MTGCQGELKNKKMRVRITDKDGKIFYDGTTRTYNNGFMGFWLPRDKKLNIEIESEGSSGVYSLSTFKDSPTCLTDYRLN